VRRLLLFTVVLAAFGVRHLPWISDHEARGISLVVAVAGGILYVDGHGMAVGLALLVLVVWVAWHGGVPEFSDLGWI
jgi:hypothetical protein